MITEIVDIGAEPEDTIQFLGNRFVEEGKLPGSFRPEFFRKTWGLIFKMGMGAIWKLEIDGKLAGGFGGMIHPDMNDGELVAQEAFWYVIKEHRGGMQGVRLKHAFEDWAAMKGAKRILMTHLKCSMPEKLKAFYERQGYREMETTYVKDIWQ